MTLVSWIMVSNSLVIVKSVFLGKNYRKSSSKASHNVNIFTMKSSKVSKLCWMDFAARKMIKD